ncbi:MAG: YezD family protein [Chloroflexi bacterium]|nr:YezD family protein [Chloroflexota bacterium]
MPEYVPGLPVGEIVRALNSVRFGEVRIVRQNANIVQIDKIEKTRFTQ